MNDSTVIAKPPPRYVLMAQRLVDEIVAGRHPIGGLLPTEAALCAQYDVSRHTVREAIRQVQALGLVARYQGVGTRVISSTPTRGYTHTLSSIDDLLQFATGTRLIDVISEDVTADASLAESGHFLPGQKLIRFEALRVPSNDPASLPLAWSELYVIDAFAGIREDVGVREGAVGALIEQRYGVRIMEIHQEINAVNLGEDLAQRLRAPAASPALRVERRYYGEDGKVFEYAISVNPENRYSFSMRLTRDISR
jgi:GntR family transcriptional regulator